jgi:hypothetical protein
MAAAEKQGTSKFTAKPETIHKRVEFSNAGREVLQTPAVTQA